jgi:hypothetical protein
MTTKTKTPKTSQAVSIAATKAGSAESCERVNQAELPETETLQGNRRFTGNGFRRGQNNLILNCDVAGSGKTISVGDSGAWKRRCLL